MGIDVWAVWEGQLPEEAERQMKVWTNTEAGHVGYLRESYHGNIYATRHLVREAFEQPDGAEIAAAVLRERLPEALRLAERREREVYQTADAEAIERSLKSYRDFVALCERVERESGKPVLIVAWW
jgi:hypothetical protein